MSFNLLNFAVDPRLERERQRRMQLIISCVRVKNHKYPFRNLTNICHAQLRLIIYLSLVYKGGEKEFLPVLRGNSCRAAMASVVLATTMCLTLARTFLVVDAIRSLGGHASMVARAARAANSLMHSRKSSHGAATLRSSSAASPRPQVKPSAPGSSKVRYGATATTTLSTTTTTTKTTKLPLLPTQQSVCLIIPRERDIIRFTHEIYFVVKPYLEPRSLFFQEITIPRNNLDYYSIHIYEYAHFLASGPHPYIRHFPPQSTMEV